MIEIQKVLTKLSKEKRCEVIGRWKKACVRHFYWSVTSTEEDTREKQGQVILAKFNAFLSHIINNHRDLPSKVFKRCAHGAVITPKVWLTKGINMKDYFVIWV